MHVNLERGIFMVHGGSSANLVPRAGIEPARPFAGKRRILSQSMASAPG
jgi:hypothetical protein